MPLQAIVTWIANHVGLGSIKNVTGIRKDLTDTKKAKLEIKKLEKEADPPLVQPATFQDVKEYDPNYQALEKRIRDEQKQIRYYRKFPFMTIWQIIILLIILLLLLFTMPFMSYVIRLEK